MGALGARLSPLGESSSREPSAHSREPPLVASLRLRTEPTVHQVDVILACVEGALDRRSARVRRGTRGEVRFRMPPPWQAAGAGMLRLVTSGEVNVIAGWGEPRRLHYDLSFLTLY